jgi:hypothetical protein
MQNCRTGAAPANSKSMSGGFQSALNHRAADWRPPLPEVADYLLANRAQIAQKSLIMKRYSLVIGIIVAVTCSNLLAQEKAALQPNATVLSLLQGSAGKAVELHLRSGEKMGGKVAGVTENVVHLSNLTGAEFFDAFIDAKDISAMVVRVAGK